MQNLTIVTTTIVAAQSDGLIVTSSDGIYSIYQDNIYRNDQLLHQTDGQVIHAKYLEDQESLFLAYASGELVLLNQDYETVCCIEGGIIQAQWSPMDDLLVLVTQKQEILLLDSSYEVINNVQMDEQVPAFVNVGWGKEDTQFKGAGARARQQTQQQEEDDLPEVQNNSISISWRGDGGYFAIGYLQEGKRVFRVFDNEGYVKGQSESVVGLEHPLAWRPSGNYITSVAQGKVLLFERNGLKHRWFDLLSKDPVDSLSWNADSSILAVNYDDRTELWTSANYHWSRKQVIQGSGLTWDQEDPLLFYVKSLGSLVRYQMVSRITRNDSLSEGSQASVAYIDGTQVHLTPFKLMNIPHPMSRVQIECNQQVVDVAFASFGTGEDFAVLLEDGTVYVYRDMKLAETYPMEGHRLLYVDAQRVLVQNGMSLSSNTGEQVEFDEPIVMVHANCGEVYVQLESGLVYKMSTSLDSKIQMQSWKRFVEVSEVNGTLIGLDISSNLVIDFKIYCKNVTSYAVTQDFIMYTTSQHQLQFLSTLQDLTKLDETSRSVQDVFNESFRRVERGCKILTVVPHDVQLVFYLPRGNFETVYPRALVLSVVRKLLNFQKYRQALVECRKHRIDMNILCDHNMPKFLEDVEMFVRQIDNVDHLNLFLSGLKSEDVTRSIYSGFQSNQSNPQVDGKVNSVSEAILQACITVDEAKFRNTILTAHVTKRPQELNKLLQRIWSIRQSHGSLEASKAIKYVKVFVDIHMLYNQALATYNFPLVVLVAEQSDMDPKEYLPFLEELQAYPEMYRQYKIELHLKNYGKALEKLTMAGDEHFGQVCEFTVKHSMYKQAIALYKDRQQQQYQLLKEYGLHLHGNGNFEDAFLCFLKCNEFQMGIKSCMKGLLWEQLFMLIQMAKLPDYEVQQYVSEMSDALSMQDRYSEAAQVVMDYGQSSAEAIPFLLEGKLWIKAYRLTLQHSMSTKGLQKEVLVQSKANMIEIAEIQTKLDDYLTRLRNVRQRKLDEIEQLNSQFENQDFEDVGDIDVYSDVVSMVTGSQMSQFSQSTFMTRTTACTNRKKEERRKMSGKVGSPYEEEYLIDAVKKLSEKVDAMKEDIKSLLDILVILDQDALQLSSKFGELVQAIKNCKKEVFEHPPLPINKLPPMTKLQIQRALQDDAVPEDVSALLTKLYTPATKPKSAQAVQWKNVFSEQ